METYLKQKDKERRAYIKDFLNSRNGKKEEQQRMLYGMVAMGVLLLLALIKK